MLAGPPFRRWHCPPKLFTQSAQNLAHVQYLHPLIPVKFSCRYASALLRVSLEAYPKKLSGLLRNPVRFEAKLVKLGAKPVEFRLYSIRFRVKSIRFGVKSIRLGVKSVRLGAKSVRLGAKSVRLGAKSVRLGAKSARLGAKSVRLGAKSARFEVKLLQACHRRKHDNQANIALNVRKIRSKSPHSVLCATYRSQRASLIGMTSRI